MGCRAGGGQGEGGKLPKKTKKVLPIRPLLKEFFKTVGQNSQLKIKTVGQNSQLKIKTVGS